MNRIAIALASVVLSIGTFQSKAQFSAFPKSDGWKKTYRPSADKINDLIHTKLEVKFDFDKSYMYGKEWVTLKPHFYDTDSLRLDAKGMDINQIAIISNGNGVRPVGIGFFGKRVDEKKLIALSNLFYFYIGRHGVWLA